jgi:hypothetical protein
MQVESLRLKRMFGYEETHNACKSNARTPSGSCQAVEIHRKRRHHPVPFPTQKAPHMPTIYEKRTYNVVVGQMAEVVRLYSTQGWPALEAGGFSSNLIGYFTSDTGELHQLVHLWRFDSDDARRAFWAKLFADENFMAFAKQLRPLLKSQSNQLLLSAPWGPKP